MARTSVGIRPQAESQTALFAYFAARLNGIPTRQFDAAFQSWGLAVRQDGALRAASSAKAHPPTKERPGRKGGSPDATQRDRHPRSGTFRDWLLIDELRLDLEVALVTIPGAGTHQTEVVAALQRLPGVRHIMELQRDRSIVAILVFAGPQRRRELRAQVEELATPLIWDDVLFESQEPSVLTWRDLARRVGEQEGLT